MELIAIYLTNCESNERIFCQRKYNYLKIQEMIKKMSDYYKKCMNSKDHELSNELKSSRDVLIAVRSSVDKNWYRAYIRSINNDLVNIYFADFGIKDSIELKYCRQLLSEFNSLPPQAIPCKPLNDNLNLSVLNHYQKNHITLQMEYIKRHQNFVEVKLYLNRSLIDCKTNQINNNNNDNEVEVIESRPPLVVPQIPLSKANRKSSADKRNEKLTNNQMNNSYPIRSSFAVWDMNDSRPQIPVAKSKQKSLANIRTTKSVPIITSSPVCDSNSKTPPKHLPEIPVSRSNRKSLTSTRNVELINIETNESNPNRPSAAVCAQYLKAGEELSQRLSKYNCILSDNELMGCLKYCLISNCLGDIEMAAQKIISASNEIRSGNLHNIQHPNDQTINNTTNKPIAKEAVMLKLRPNIRITVKND